MTCDVSISNPIAGKLSTNLSDSQEKKPESKPRGEVAMTPENECEKEKEPHETIEEEKKRKNRIFESYLLQRVL